MKSKVWGGTVSVHQLEADAGEDIWGFCDRLCAAAPSWGLFNETPTLAASGDLPADVEKRWRRVRNVIQKRNGDYNTMPSPAATDYEETDAILATLAVLRSG